MESLRVPYEHGYLEMPMLEIKEANLYIVAATPICKQPMTIPYRVVLVWAPDNEATPWIVWHEHFKEGANGEPLIHNCFHDGRYFKEDQYVQALRDFGALCLKMAGHCESLGRVVVLESNLENET